MYISLDRSTSKKMGQTWNGFYSVIVATAAAVILLTILACCPSYCCPWVTLGLRTCLVCAK